MQDVYKEQSSTSRVSLVYLRFDFISCLDKFTTRCIFCQDSTHTITATHNKHTLLHLHFRVLLVFLKSTGCGDTSGREKPQHPSFTDEMKAEKSGKKEAEKRKKNLFQLQKNPLAKILFQCTLRFVALKPALNCFGTCHKYWWNSSLCKALFFLYPSHVSLNTLLFLSSTSIFSWIPLYPPVTRCGHVFVKTGAFCGRYLNSCYLPSVWTITCAFGLVSWYSGYKFSIV